MTVKVSEEPLVATKAIENLKRAFYTQDDALCPEYVQIALAAGANPVELLEKYLMGWTEDLASRTFYQFNEAADSSKPTSSASDLIMLAECLQACMWVLKPGLEKANVNFSGRIVIGKIGYDYYGLGYQIIASVLSAVGYEVINLGMGNLMMNFVRSALEKKANIIVVVCSAGQSKIFLKDMVAERDKKGLKDKVKILVVDQMLSEKAVESLGIDVYAANLQEVFKKVNELMRNLKK